MKQKLLAWCLILALLSALLPSALADSVTRYVALGDELSTEAGEVSSFPQRLADRQGWELENLAQTGMTAEDLLWQLQRDEDVIQAVRTADVITVTIGWNDLLAACLQQFGRYMDLDEAPETVEELQQQGVAWLLSQGTDSALLLDHLVGLCGALEQNQAEAALETFIQDFAKQWSTLAARLLDLNPKAQILVLEGYNPYSAFTDYGSNGIYVGQVIGYWSGQLLSAVRQEKHCGTDYLAVDCSRAEGSAWIDLDDLLDAPSGDEEGLLAMMDLSVLPTEAGLETMAAAVLRAMKFHELRQLCSQEEVDLPFQDLDSEDRLYEAVELVYGAGLMEGVSATRFDPQGSLTRAMVVTILYRMESAPAVRWTAPFEDVSQGKWYSDAVQWAWDSGIAQGSGNGIFGPDEPVTGQELAAFFYRYAQLNQMDTSGSKEMLAQAEALIQLHTLDAWALDCVVWALTGGMMDLSMVRPNEPASRGDTAWFVYALLESIAE